MLPPIIQADRASRAVIPGLNGSIALASAALNSEAFLDIQSRFSGLIANFDGNIFYWRVFPAKAIGD